MHDSLTDQPKMTEPGAKAERRPSAGIKCVIWDLDNTLWQGILVEGDRLALTPGVAKIVRALDDRGILQSIASRNDFDHAWDKVIAFGLEEYFLHPQIGWASKAESVRAIAEALAIGLEAVALVDDEPFERDEVRFCLPEVTTIDAAQIGGLLDLPALKPGVATADAKRRRAMYQADLRRRRDEAGFAGARDEFLATLGMVLTIRPATSEDLQRAEELTLRTNQLNTTGRTYSPDRLEALIRSPDHLLLVAELEDRYGPSGTIGLALVELDSEAWLVRLLVMSCRVVGRGIGGFMISHILQSAKRRGVRLLAEFVPTDRNRMMYVTYRFSGFFEAGEADGAILLEHGLDGIRPIPPYLTLRSAGV